MTENQLLEEVRSGNQRVLTNIYNKFRQDFINWANKNYTCSIEDAKEIYQLSFFIFYDNVMTGKLENLSSNIKTYLFAIGKNKILELSRRNAKYAYDINEEIFEMGEEEFEMTQEREKHFHQISLGLLQLGDPCKKILEMMYYESRSMDYITEKLGYKNVDTTKNQKYKCLQRLKKIVESVNV